MKIPIENIYYLLCYAWNKLEEKERVNVSIDDKKSNTNVIMKCNADSIAILGVNSLLIKTGRLMSNKSNAYK